MNLDRVKYGLRPAAQPFACSLNLGADRPQIEDTDRWMGLILPADDQQENSCVFRSTCGALEAKIRSALGLDAIREVARARFGTANVNWQLDARLLYRLYCDRYNEGKDEGAQLDSGFRMAVEEGLLPASAELVRLPSSLDGLSAGLKISPVIQGSGVSSAWATPDRQNGQIDPGPLPSPVNLHATAIVGLLSQGAWRFVAFANSWGDWGRYGVGLQREDQWRRDLAMDPLAIRVDDDWWRTSNWSRWMVRA